MASLVNGQRKAAMCDVERRSKGARTRRMTVGELRLEYATVFGEPARSGNRQWLFRRVAWRVQAMANLSRRLLDVLAGSTQADVRRQIQYLKAENDILRSKIDGPVWVTREAGGAGSLSHVKISYPCR